MRITASAMSSGIATSMKKGVAPVSLKAGRTIGEEQQGEQREHHAAESADESRVPARGRGGAGTALDAAIDHPRQRQAQHARAPARASSAGLTSAVSRRREVESGRAWAGVDYRVERGVREDASRVVTRERRCLLDAALEHGGKEAVAAMHVRQELQRGAGIERDVRTRELGGHVALRELPDVRRGSRRRWRRSPRAARCRWRRRCVRRASRAWRPTRGSMPASRRARPRRSPCWRHLRSGLRRSVPKPVQGASTSTRSILPARRLTLVSRSCAITCGCTFDRSGAREARRELGEAVVRPRRRRRAGPASA